MSGKIKNLKEIVSEYLIANGFDGLGNDNIACSCATDNLMACEDFTFGDGPSSHCVAGYRGKCDCGEGCDFHIVSTQNNPDPKGNA